MSKSAYDPADYLSGVDAGYKAILFEFEFRELS